MEIREREREEERGVDRPYELEEMEQPWASGSMQAWWWTSRRLQTSLSIGLGR
jgi:hypothetical protein